MATNAKDVAAYILEKKGSLTGYQLQKLLYYCQAWCLAETGAPLFDDPIEAWKHGPVVASVSRLHQHCFWVNRRHIPDADAARISLADQCLIDSVLDAYGDLSGEQLESLTHREEPWVQAYNGHAYYGSSVISTDAMRKYYSELLAGGPAVRGGHVVPVFSGPRIIYVSDQDYDWLASDDE